MRPATISFVTLALGTSPTLAFAHIALLEPPARYSRDFVKAGPCGHAENPPGEVQATYVAGDTIAVRWDEFIGHPGHFRVSLSAVGDGAFVDPAGYDDLYVADNVLLDDIEDPDGRREHEVQITLPVVECDACVLQLVQVMTDKPPWGPDGGNDLYYQCADIRLVGSASELPQSSGSAAEDDADSSGCAAARPSLSGNAWLWMLLGLAAARRAKRRS